MNKILLLIYFFSTYSFYAQSEASSFYFKSPQPLGIDSAFEFNENYIGSFYKANDSLVRVVIDRDSIFSEFIIMLTISQKKLKKNKKLKLGDSLLFGVKASGSDENTVNKFFEPSSESLGSPVKALLKALDGILVNNQ